MKKYRYSVIDWNVKRQNKVIMQSYVDGLANVRKVCPVPLHYSQKSKAFLGFGDIENGKEYWAVEC